MLDVKFAFVRSSRSSQFYGTGLPKKTPSAWRLIVDGRWALRVGFNRKCDALMAKTALEKAGIDDGKKIVSAGWMEVQRVIFDGLAW